MEQCFCAFKFCCLFHLFPLLWKDTWQKDQILFLSCVCTLWPVNLCIATAVRDGKDKILLGWQAGNPSALCFQFYLQTEPTSYREESKCTCDAFSEHKGRWRFLSIFFFFFHKDGRKALNMNLLSYKTADVHLALDLKVNTKPEGHLVLPRMKIKVWVSFSSLARQRSLINM